MQKDLAEGVTNAHLSTEAVEVTDEVAAMFPAPKYYPEAPCLLCANGPLAQCIGRHSAPSAHTVIYPRVRQLPLSLIHI